MSEIKHFGTVSAQPVRVKWIVYQLPPVGMQMVIVTADGHRTTLLRTQESRRVPATNWISNVMVISDDSRLPMGMHTLVSTGFTLTDDDTIEIQYLDPGDRVTKQYESAKIVSLTIEHAPRVH